VAALRERRGVLGTRFRSPRRLVRALAGCVPGLPGRQERLLRLRYGVGGASARPDRAVAAALGLPRGGYGTLLGRALRGLVHDARVGGCADGSATGRGAQLVAFGDDGGVRTGPATARVAAGAADVAEVAVRGEDASRQSGAADAAGGAPIALGADAPGGSLLSPAVLAAALALLALLGAAGLRR
jgi:hypothetical protein